MIFNENFSLHMLLKFRFEKAMRSNSKMGSEEGLCEGSRPSSELQIFTILAQSSQFPSKLISQEECPNL